MKNARKYEHDYPISENTKPLEKYKDIFEGKNYAMNHEKKYL